MLSLNFQDRIESIGIQADQFVNSGHFDADNIKTKQEQVVQRYDALLVKHYLYSNTFTILAQSTLMQCKIKTNRLKA